MNPKYILSEPETENQAEVSQPTNGVVMQAMPAECESCPTTLASLRAETPSRTLHYFMAMWLCPSCLLQEKTLQAQSAADADERVRASRALSSASGNGASQVIELQEEIFNASTLAIMELKRIVDADETIPQDKKAFELGMRLQGKHKEFQQVIFDARETLTQAGNAARAIQQYMNTLSNQLRAEEREKLKLQDVSYNPAAHKPRPKPTAGAKSKTRMPKAFNKEACREAAVKYGVPMEMVQTLVTVKSISYDEAAKLVASKLAAN